MFGLSAGELLLITLIALLLFGNEKLPQNIRKFFKGWNQSKKVVFDMQKSWRDIKLDLKNNVEIYDDKAFLKNEESDEIKEGSGSKVLIKPVYNIVSQEDIDTHQQKLENNG